MPAVNELRRSPEEAVRQADYAWNLAARLLGDWPKHKLDVPSRDRRYVLPLATYSEIFARDLEGFIQKLERPDLSKDESLERPLRPAKVRHRRAQVLRFASVIVLAGADPSDIRGLTDLVEPARARQGIQWLLERGKDGEVGPGASDMAILLKTLVRHHVRCSKDDRDAIIKLSRQLAVAPAKGLTAKNRERLRPFEDEEALHQLATLPARFFAQASGAVGLKATLRREEAVAIAILLNCPIRRRNLVTWHLDQSLRSLKNGRVFLCFDASEVKNRHPIDFELPSAVLALVQEHVATRSPLLCPPGTPWLFPRRDGAKHMDPSGLSDRIAARTRKETGLEVHAHLFRHFAAKVWLGANPGQHEALRRILGHAELSSTLNACAGFEAGTTTRLYADLIAKAQGAFG